jgi:hypothetical protein
VIGGLLGGVLGLRRIGAVRAGHKIGHHCTASDRHPCENGECREVNGEWTCQVTCLALGAVCVRIEDCCPDPASTVFCCVNTPGGPTICDTDCLD